MRRVEDPEGRLVKPDPLLRVLLEVATAIAERKRRERAERRRRLAVVVKP